MNTKNEKEKQKEKECVGLCSPLLFLYLFLFLFLFLFLPSSTITDISVQFLVEFIVLYQFLQWYMHPVLPVIF